MVGVIPTRIIMVLALLVVVEVAVLVPVIVTQRAADLGEASAHLVTLTKDLGDRLNTTIAGFVYNVVLASGAVPRSGFLSQDAMEDLIQLSEDPRSTPALLYFWIPVVPAAERSAYADFYGFNITELKNGSTTQAVPVPPDSPRPYSAPYTLFVPRLPPDANLGSTLFGLDLFAFPTVLPTFRNQSKYLVAPSGLVSRSPNNYGLVAVARDKGGRGYMFGRIGSKELLEFSLSIPREDVMLAAYVTTSPNATRQALYFEDSPEMQNVTTVKLFDALPIRSQFFTTEFTLLGEKFMVAARYTNAFAAQYAGNTWVILAAVLAPVCFLVDVIWVILAMLWVRRKKMHQVDLEKRREAQVMVNYVNHEIRNPLQTILGLSDLHLEEAEAREDERLISDLKTIIRAAEFIEHIATDILDLRKVEEGKLVLEVSEISVKDLISGLEKSVAVLVAQKSGVEFCTRVSSGVSLIRSDRYRLEQILMNFVTNAFKNTEKGSVSLVLDAVSDNWVRFSVIDTGKGIAPEMKEKMFQEFSQSSAKDANVLGGFGLGLYLTKMLAKLLGGTVGFTSELGHGSTFWVELPVGIEETKDVAEQFLESQITIKM